MAQLFDGSITYTAAETPNVQTVTYNGDGSSTVTFSASPPDTGYTYTVTITDSYGDVHIHEGNSSAMNFPGNDYYGVLTGYSNGGDFTVYNNYLGSTEDHFTWLFTQAPEGQGGAVILYSDSRAGNFVPPVCFAEGAHILSTRGDIPVETLAVGDILITASGEHRPIRWLGHRMIDCRRHADPPAVWPVCIAAHAFGPNKPARDLYVSPGHSICLDLVGEVLIPAQALVNGSTIAQVEVDEVTYWHVELDSHDVILAENLPAESYLDMANRTFFTESDVVALDVVPDSDSGQRTHADFCRPYHEGGPLIEAVRAQTRALALASGWRLSTTLDVHLEVDGRRIDPVVLDRAMRFLVPAEAKDVWLVSPTARPSDTIIGSSDGRTLGLDLTALRIDDGFGSARDISIDDPLLDVGFSHVEGGSHRWTTGRARLPADLWKGCTGGFFLRIDLGGPPPPRWVAPETDKAVVRLAA